MNVLYVGSCDSFAAKLVNKLVKEDHKINIFANKNFDSKIKPKLNYKWYEFDVGKLGTDKVFSSVRPEVVIFGGELFGTACWEHDASSNEYMTQLRNTLHFSTLYGCKKFIYLSGTEVYGIASLKGCNEDSETMPTVYKGVLCKEGEMLTESICRINEIEAVILRFSQIYGYELFEKKKDVISSAYEELHTLKSIDLERPNTIAPVFTKDAAEATHRAIGSTPSSIYNVAAKLSVSEGELYTLLKEKTNAPAELLLGESSTGMSVSVERIMKELEWFNYSEIGNYIAGYEAKPLQEEKRHKFKKRGRQKWSIISIVENVVIFLLFAIFASTFQDHSVLKNIDMMYLYIILSSLLFGVKQSILSVIFAFIYYLRSIGLANQAFMTVMLNADTFLQLAQYIFMGVVVSYAVEQGKSKLEQAQIEKEYLENEYNELKEINDDNILIKRQYEKRLLGYKTSLPKLYAITSSLDSLNPEVIFDATVKIFKEIIDTETISVYALTQFGYARLVASLNEESVFAGKSFRLADYPQMEEKLTANEVFIGNQWTEDSPSMAGAVFHKGNIIALIIIKEMSLQNLNLYQANLFKTLLSLITASLIKAYQYEDKLRSEKYIADTEILKEADFRELLHIKYESRNNKIVDFTLIKLTVQGDPVALYNQYSNTFRTTDFFGIGEDGALWVLLVGTNIEGMEFVDARLTQKDITYQVIDCNTIFKGE